MDFDHQRYVYRDAFQTTITVGCDAQLQALQSVNFKISVVNSHTIRLHGVVEIVSPRDKLAIYQTNSAYLSIYSCLNGTPTYRLFKHSDDVKQVYDIVLDPSPIHSLKFYFGQTDQTYCFDHLWRLTSHHDFKLIDQYDQSCSFKFNRVAVT